MRLLPLGEIGLDCSEGAKPFAVQYSTLRFGPYNILGVTDLSINCHMTLSAMHYLLNVIKFVSDWRQVGGFLRVLRFFLHQ